MYFGLIDFIFVLFALCGLFRFVFIVSGGRLFSDICRTEERIRREMRKEWSQKKGDCPE